VSGATDLLLTVVLTGRGPLHRDLRRAGALDDLLREVRDELGTASPFVWIDRIIDRTGAELDREAIARRGDFSSELIRLSNDLRARPEVFKQTTEEIWRLGERFEIDDAESLLREAEERALDLLEGEIDR
jgi:exonuclease SbcD